jgi:UDP-2,3-diacylglucosamine pyrophosphatase LpxH
MRAVVPAQAATRAAQCVDTFLFSDLHLGSDVSRSKELLEVLQSYSFKRLILLGDIFDDLNFKRLRRDHWEMLSWLRKLSDPDRNVEIVWILGNHDVLLENISHFIGIQLCDKYAWEHRGKRFLAIHGHQFDRFLEENVVVSEIATILYLWVQKLDTRRQRFSRLLKRLSKKWLRLSHQVAVRAARYGRMQGADYVFCGHTHHAACLQLEGVSYFNTGCWTDIPSHFITIDQENRIELHEHE